MQCWRNYILGAEGLVVLARFAEDCDDNDDSHTEPSALGLGGEEDEDETLTSRLFVLREALRQSSWCPRGPRDRFAISPAVSCLHGVLEFGMHDEPPEKWGSDGSDLYVHTAGLDSPALVPPPPGPPCPKALITGRLSSFWCAAGRPRWRRWPGGSQASSPASACRAWRRRRIAASCSR